MSDIPDDLLVELVKLSANLDELQKDVAAMVAVKERLRQALAGVMLLADDYTRDPNERLALISKRCRDELRSQKKES